MIRRRRHHGRQLCLKIPARKTALDPIVIEPAKAARHYWRDIWRYRELLYFLAWRDIKVRYKQTALGIVWALLQPLVPLVVFTFIFGKVANMPSGGAPYPLLVMVGLLPWQLFSAAFSTASSSVISNANLVSKVYFPRLIVPLSALAVSLVDFVVVLGLWAVLATYFGYLPTFRALATPGFLLMALTLALGSGLWTSALMVKYRDVRYIVPFVLQLGFFLSPIGFDTANTPTWRVWFSLNPISGIIDGFRWCLLGNGVDYTFNWLSFAISLGMILVFTATGLWYFRRTERSFADLI